MVIKSLHGVFFIVTSKKDKNQLLIRSKSKSELIRIFGGKRIVQYDQGEIDYEISVCRQEFANTLIMMIKEINYDDFQKHLPEIDFPTDSIFA